MSSIYTLFFYGWTIITVFFYAWADFSKGTVTQYYSVALLLFVFMMGKLTDVEDEKVRKVTAVIFSIFILFPGFYWIHYNHGHFSFLGHVFLITLIGFLGHGILALAILWRGFCKR